jgi:hypothetical protein
MTTAAPYLSIVAAARNDNHGGDLLRRLQIFTDGILRHCKRCALPAELIIVEWNPPPDRPPLADALTWKIAESPCVVRFIEVPSNVHHRFAGAQGLPLFQMKAKNVGIRRARGAFVLATNVDLLFSVELFDFLATQTLRADALYRIDRSDVRADVPLTAELSDQLGYCEKNILRINGLHGTRPVHETDASLLSRALGWLPSRLFPSPSRLRAAYFALPEALRRTLRRRVSYALKERFETHGRNEDWIARRGYPRLHTNNCGDFTLLSKSIWGKIRGYAEIDAFAVHLDGLACHAAHHAGAREAILAPPMRAYHIEHGSGWTAEGNRRLAGRLEAAGVRALTIEEFEAWARRMQRDREPLILNDEHWGLAQENLSERVIGALPES